MAKNKKKRGLAEKLAQKAKKPSQKKPNPFEIKINRSKQNVLGKKVAKHDKGMPGVSRSKAIKKREATLLVEYEKRGKASLMLDKRIGENDNDMLSEDKILARYAAERKKSHKSVFSLNDDEEELTHYGQSLAEVENLDEKEFSEEEEDEHFASKVAQEQFGGFRKWNEEDQAHKSWKDRMDEIISQSKKAKFERQTEKEKEQQLTDDLDKQWKELQSLVVTSGKGTVPTDTKIKDDYDITVGELKFEATGKASDRLKSDEELAHEEKARLEKLEADRMRRMKGIVEEQEEVKEHRSADDLDDGLMIGDGGRGNKSKVLEYKDGKLDTGEDGSDDEEEEDDVDEESSEEAEEENEDGDAGKDADEDSTAEGESEDEEMNEEEEDDGEEKVEVAGADDDVDESDEGSGEDEDDDDYSDLDMENEEGEDEDDEKMKFIEKLIKKKQVMEAARKEIPFTFKAPQNYDDFEDLLNEYEPEKRGIVLDRLRKCTHLSLNEENSAKLKLIQTFLFDYIINQCSEVDLPSGKLLDALLVHAYQMTQQFPADAARKLAAEIHLRHEEFQEITGDKAWHGQFPGLDTLIILKMVGLFFPTSDFSHPVVVAAMLLIARILSQAVVRDETDLAVGLFLCSIYLDYQKLSKRVMPELLNFIHTAVYTAVDKSKHKMKCFPPNLDIGEPVNLLRLKVKSLKSNIGKLKLSETIRTEDTDMANDDFRLRAIKLTLFLADKFVDLYSETAAFTMMFKPLLQVVQILPLENWPTELRKIQSQLLAKLEEPRKLTYIVKAKNKPKPMKLLEPKFDEVFEDRKKRVGSRENKERQTLIHKLKKEKKGALREIRKDTQFLARVKLKERTERDEERKRKVKEIHGMLANQEGEFKAMKRKRTS